MKGEWGKKIRMSFSELNRCEKKRGGGENTLFRGPEKETRMKKGVYKRGK